MGHLEQGAFRWRKRTPLYGHGRGLGTVWRKVPLIPVRELPSWDHKSVY